MSTVSFTNGRGQRLVAEASGLDSRRGAVVLVPGLSRNRRAMTVTAIAGALEEEGIGSLRLDLAGCGDSEGNLREFTISRASHDVATAVAWLQDRAGPHVPIGGCGISSGGLIIAAALLGGAPLDALALVAPVADYPTKRARELGPEGLATWRETGVTEWRDPEGRVHLLGSAFLHDAERWVIRADRFRARGTPTLIVHGTADDNTPFTHALTYQEVLPVSDLVPVPMADHHLMVDGRRYPVEAEVAGWYAHRWPIRAGEEA